jgi:hypothetical protein
MISNCVFTRFALNILATVLTVWRSLESPFFKVMVTGPEASVQVNSIGCPAVIPLKAEFVNETAFAKPKATAAMRALENCILMVLIDGLRRFGMSFFLKNKELAMPHGPNASAVTQVKVQQMRPNVATRHAMGTVDVTY